MKSYFKKSNNTNDYYKRILVENNEILVQIRNDLK